MLSIVATSRSAWKPTGTERGGDTQSRASFRRKVGSGRREILRRDREIRGGRQARQEHERLEGLGWVASTQATANRQGVQEIIAIEPKHPAALNGLGQSAFLRGDYKNAEKYLLKAAPQAPAAWWGLAKTYLLQGEFDKAKKWAKKIVDSGDADESAQQMLKAAEAKKLDDELRQTIEPAGAAKAEGDADKEAAKDVSTRVDELLGSRQALFSGSKQRNQGFRRRGWRNRSTRRFRHGLNSC
jgi:tetratricopeptide (TPR) repeat protein